jgi:hypothetical protein
MVREDLVAGKSWKIRRALSQIECKEIIEITEKQQVGLHLCRVSMILISMCGRQ